MESMLVRCGHVYEYIAERKNGVHVGEMLNSAIVIIEYVFQESDEIFFSLVENVESQKKRSLALLNLSMEVWLVFSPT